VSTASVRPLRAYSCDLRGANWGSTTIHATSRGKARSEYFRRVREPFPDVRFTDVHVLTVGPPISSDAFKTVARSRGVPFARVGMKVEVEGHAGVIVGHNDSANFDVLFSIGPHAGATGNCHPNWMFKYFSDEGYLIEEFAA